MHHQEFAPPEGLQAAIKCFWHTRLDAGERPAGLEVLPDGYAEIVFHFGPPCSILTPAGWQPLPSPLLMGLLSQPVQLRPEGRFEVLGIRCYPWMVFGLLGLPAGTAGARHLEHPLARLQAPLAALVQAGAVAEAVALMAQFFLAARAGVAASELLGRAGAAMRATHGTLPVRQVAAAAHATVRTLERQFKQAAGHTVKDVSGLMRFEQVRNRLWLHPEASLAGLAQELGYADQAHLSREFRRYTGTTPAAFARKAKQAKPAADFHFVAFVQA